MVRCSVANSVHYCSTSLLYHSPLLPQSYLWCLGLTRWIREKNGLLRVHCRVNSPYKQLGAEKYDIYLFYTCCPLLPVLGCLFSENSNLKEDLQQRS